MSAKFPRGGGGKAGPFLAQSLIRNISIFYLNNKPFSWSVLMYDMHMKFINFEDVCNLYFRHHNAVSNVYEWFMLYYHINSRMINNNCKAHCLMRML